MKFIKTYSFFIFIFLLSCTLNTAKLNGSEDIANTKKIVNKFYDELKYGNYKNTIHFLSDTLIKRTDTSTLFNFYRKHDIVNGNIININLIKCETKMEYNGREKILKGIAIYNVQRSKINTQERFLLKAINESPLKIQRYDIIENRVKK